MSEFTFGLLFAPNRARITGCGGSSPSDSTTIIDVADAATPPDATTDTNGSHWTDILPDIFPDIEIIKPDISEKPDAGDIPDTPDGGELPCQPSIEIPYDHMAQSCVIDLADVDGDGYCQQGYAIENNELQCPKESGNIGTDCNDVNLTVNPTAVENCNTIDDNCDGQSDENLTKVSYSGPAETVMVGNCLPKIEQCVNGNIVIQQEITPQPETCNNQDDNCNGQTDEPAETTVITYNGPIGTQGVGLCQPEIKVCQNGILIITQTQIQPQPEIACNSDDEDCNGIAFQGTDADGDTFKTEGGLCGPIDCTDNNPNIKPNANEICGNGIDENCDGTDFVGTEIRVTNDPANSMTATMVWNGTNFGIAWADNRDDDGSNSNYEIYFALVDGNGNKIGPDHRITVANGYSYQPSMAWNSTDSRFGVVWTDNRLGPDQIFFAEIDSNGNKVGLGGDIQKTFIPPAGWIDEPFLCWDGNKGYAMAWQDGRNSTLVPFNPVPSIFFRNFTIGQEQEIAVGVPLWSYPSVVTNNNGYALTWTANQVNALFFDNDTNQLGYLPPLANAPISPSEQFVLWDETNQKYSIVWVNDQMVNPLIHFAQFNSQGIITPDFLYINLAMSFSPVLAKRANGFGLTWHNFNGGSSSLLFAILSENGIKTSNDIVISPSANSFTYAVPSIVWADTKFGIAWEDTKDGNPEIYFSTIECQ